MENSPRSPEGDGKDQDYQQRRVAPEANQLHGKELPPESIGHMLVSAEPQPVPEAKPQPGSTTSKEAIDLQRVATMSRSELLDISEEIIVDSTSLRHVYESHLIGENGLRRLIYEHMRGGNLQEALHHEILEHETEFERDPNLRHQELQPTNLTAETDAATPPELNNLLSRVGLTKLDPEKELTAPKLLPEHMTKQPRLQPSQRRLLDVVFVLIILVLLVLVLMLAMSRG